MRDRLIELLKEANDIVKRNGFKFNANVMTDYLLENGVIVPQQYVDIKIGQVVYMVYPTRIRELKVHDINYSLKKTGCSIYYYCEVLNENVCDLFYPKDIGYTTFLTKEEAELKLLKIKNYDCAGCSFYDTDITDQPCCTCTCGSNFASGDNL